MNTSFFQTHVLVPGEASGPLLASKSPLSFWGGYHPGTGEIIDRRHDLSGQLASGHILAIPGTRGSSTSTAVLLEAVRSGVAPAGFIITDRDTFLSLASIVAHEMYERSLPVVQVNQEQFETVLHANFAEISQDGSLFISRESIH